MLPAERMRSAPIVSVLPLNHAREISLFLHPSIEGRFDAHRHPRAGFGAFPLHLHRAMNSEARIPAFTTRAAYIGAVKAEIRSASWQRNIGNGERHFSSRIHTPR